MTIAVLSLGSNLGDRAGYLGRAVAGLGDSALRVSRVYETPPWGDPDQPAYLNAAVLARSLDDDPRYWLRVARGAETLAGRQRDPSRRFAPRTLDVDIVAVFTVAGEPVLCPGPELILPHPLAHRRAFVLRPWLDIQPDAVLPGHGSVRDLTLAGPIAEECATLRPYEGVRLDAQR
ncbi:MAG: 2-amino-4-hydroxy-6-hydroxymethyldihydropteridine diphosphokinase [Dactylosporangium sp.]|nr:2-amino-4-hydroxy-6-hydroxymethyldihydropteridine diphosphokinase [Dactylosporangium sp.]NNJ63292.1 2-amino-4-hydroxy-6-hydroxymethyldihydropteridine diphosphokinase [Dactylosporangium sp.]